MLEAVDVSMEFGGRPILEAVSISVSPGERIALLGPSGSGKTTLLRILVGILRPTSGSVACLGQPRIFHDDNDWSGWIWPRVTLVFQDIRLFPNLDGFANCSVGTDDLSLNPEATRELANEFEVGHCLGRRPHQMSLGEQQRIAIIRALVRRPSYLLMDEPTSALDSFLQERMAQIIRELPSEVSLVVATHDLAFAASIATSYVVIRERKLFSAETLHQAVDLMARARTGTALE